MPTGTGFAGAPPIPVVTPVPTNKSMPPELSEVTPEATSIPEIPVTPVPDPADTEDDSLAGQDDTGSLLGEPDTDF